MINDIYGGVPKYSSAQSIYDALDDMSKNEEQGILEQIGVDVSYESQTYYYTDKAYKLKEKFDELSNCLEDMWRFDVAIYKLDEGEIFELIYEALRNDTFAKKVKFKKILVDRLLAGEPTQYKQAAEDFYDQITEIDRYDFCGFHQAFTAVANKNNIPYHSGNFNLFIFGFQKNIDKLDVSAEIAFIAECRAHLTSYDDFMHGLRANQALYEMQEASHKDRLKHLEKKYSDRLKLVLQAAERAGVLQQLSREMKLLEAGGG